MGNTENIEEINITIYLNGVDDPICETALDLVEDEKQGIKGFKFKYKDNSNESGNDYFIAADSIVYIKKSYDYFDDEFENSQESHIENGLAGIFWWLSLVVTLILFFILSLVLGSLSVNN